MNEGIAMDNFYKQKLDEYLSSQEYSSTVEDYQGETLDAAKQTVYQLENSNSIDIFAESDAVEFFDWLKNQYQDAVDMLKDYKLDVSDLIDAIADGQFSTDGTMDFLLFMGAEKLEA
jgi:beta-lactam-binding protein with PASTA domain